MTDIEILQQLMSGNHLSNLELDRAKHILLELDVALKSRVR